MEVEVPLPDRTLFFYATANPIKDETGKVILALTHAVDITERKKAEEALGESEERYRSILEQMDDVYFEVDLAGNFTFLNESSCRKFGYSREELMGKSYGLTVPEDDIKKLFAACKAVFKSGEPNRCYPHSILRKDGSVLFAKSIIGLRRNKQSDIIGFKTVSRDVTERKQMQEALRESEKRFTLALEGTGAGVWDWDMVNNRVVYSTQWKSMLGYADHEVENSLAGWKNL